MKKIISTTSVVVAVFCAMSVLACSQKVTELTTGGACSISELENLEKAKTKQENSNLTLGEGRNLRPVRIKSEPTKFDYNSGCLLGNCLYKILLGD